MVERSVAKTARKTAAPAAGPGKSNRATAAAPSRSNRERPSEPKRYKATKAELLDFYKRLLIDLGSKGSNRVQAIYGNANSSFRHPRNLRTVVDAIDAVANARRLDPLYRHALSAATRSYCRIT